MAALAPALGSQSEQMTPELNELALFAGAGGGILGGKLLGWRCVCAVEVNDYARRVLMARQDDGSLPPFPVWDDVRTFDGKPWCGVVDIISGGFPCQDISAAGKGAGIEGERSGLWVEMSRIIGEVRPRWVLVENSPVLTSRGLGRVLWDLAALGYDARWGVLGAVHAGAPHKRERIWIVAYTDSAGCQECDPAPIAARAGQYPRLADPQDVADDPQHGRRAGRSRRSDSSGEGEREQPLQAMADADGRLRERWTDKQEREAQGRATAGGSCEGIPDASEQVSEGRADGAGWREPRPRGAGGKSREAGSEGTDWWVTEPDVGRVAHGVASRVDRLRALGNGQVPAVVALAWNLLAPELPERVAEE